MLVKGLVAFPCWHVIPGVIYIVLIHSTISSPHRPSPRRPQSPSLAVNPVKSPEWVIVIPHTTASLFLKTTYLQATRVKLKLEDFSLSIVNRIRLE